MILASAHASNSTSGNAIAGNSSTGNGVIVFPGSTVQASAATIGIAANAVILRVGKSYFQDYISLKSANTRTYTNGTNISDIAYTYNIPYTNSTTTSGYLQVGGLVTFVGISVHMINNTVTSYTGPMAPYFITVSPQEAAAAAHSYGFYNITSMYITAAYNNRSSINGPYKIAWALLDGSYISTGNCSVGCKIHPGVYINTSTGTIEGQFSVNPSIESASAPSYAILGNFSTYTLPPSQQQINTLLIDSMGVRLALIGIVAVVVVLLITWKRKAKARARRTR